MGMFDSLRDSRGVEWQTKALRRVLDRFDIGDRVPGPPIDYQMEVIGGKEEEPPFRWAFANVRGGRLHAVPVDRDPRLPLLRYSTGWEPGTEGDFDGYHEND